MKKLDPIDFSMLIVEIIFSVLSIIFFNLDFVFLGIVSLAICLVTFFRTREFSIVIGIIFFIGAMIDLYIGYYVIFVIFLVVSGICVFLPYEIYEKDLENKEKSLEKHISSETLPEDHYVMDRKMW